MSELGLGTWRRSNGACAWVQASFASRSGAASLGRGALARPGGAEPLHRTADRQVAARVLSRPLPDISPPGGAVSLWNLLGKYAATFASWGVAFERLSAELKPWVVSYGDEAMSIEHRSALLANNEGFLSEATRLCDVLELTAAGKHRARLDRALRSTGNLTWRSVSDLFDRLRQQIEDDLGDRLFFYVRPEDARAYENAPPPWDRIVKAFPSTRQDITCTWRCLALGQPTASAYHALRVAERGLQHLAVATKTKLSKTADTQNWARLIQAIEAKANAISPRTGASRERKQFLVDVLSTFDIIKDAWRDYAMHARTMYDDADARIILIAVGKAMSKVAEHYHEEGAEIATPEDFEAWLDQTISALYPESTMLALPVETADTSGASVG
jgi:hypothetical protein